MLRTHRRSAGLARRRALSLVELAVVVVIIGIVASFGVPRFFQSVERARASEAFAYLTAVQAAQEQHRLRHGTYARGVADLDLSVAAPRFFTTGPIRAGGTGSLGDSWMLTLARAGAPAGHGQYTVTFSQAGFDPAMSTIRDFPELMPAGR